jgi:superfamily I DNA and/or RNA helicase
LGRIDLHGSAASVEVPEGWDARLARLIDGALFDQRRIRAWSAGRIESAQGQEDHFQRLARLLELEAEAAAQETMEAIERLAPQEAERTGNALIELAIDEQHSGLGGRFIVNLVKRNRSSSLPWSRLGVGAPVLLSCQAGADAPSYRGVVCERSTRSVRVALNEMPSDEGIDSIWRLDHSSDEVARQRQLAALERARSARGERLSELRRILLGEEPPAFRKPVAGETLAPLDTSLDDSQREAVRFALSAQDLALIHGPPGTGKTTAIVEVIRQAVRRGEKVLVCAPSNLAVDNVLERLLACGERAVRLGHPARVLPALREHSLDLTVERHESVRMARRLVRDALGLRRQAGRSSRSERDPAVIRSLRREASELIVDARRLEAQAVESILDSADVLCSTLTSVDSDIIGVRQFDLAVVDEACQSTEPECWLPVLRSQRLVLVGDHCQLPPTVVSQEASREGLGLSLFERLMKQHGAEISRRLTVQYRMNEAIMDFSSLEFYDADLEAHPSVRHHLLSDLSGVTRNGLTQAPVTYIDTAGAGYDEEVEPDGESRFNAEEAALTLRKVRELLDSGVLAEDIAVITPYAAQVRLLRQESAVLDLEIDSVDGFQGREKEAVIISLVRSNAQNDIGFLADIRRTNVALTRARRKLLVIGDSATISSHPFYQRLLDYFDEIGAYSTVWEEKAP